MNKRIYILAQNTKNDGKVDDPQEVYDFLKGMPESAKLLDILAKFPIAITVNDITAISGDQLEALRAGDVVIKHDGTGDHSYRVSYKGATGVCLTYSDCENVETVAYEKTGDTWAYDSTDVTHISS